MWVLPFWPRVSSLQSGLHFFVVVVISIYSCVTSKRWLVLQTFSSQVCFDKLRWCRTVTPWGLLVLSGFLVTARECWMAWWVRLLACCESKTIWAWIPSIHIKSHSWLLILVAQHFRVETNRSWELWPASLAETELPFIMWPCLKAIRWRATEKDNLP